MCFSKITFGISIETSEGPPSKRARPHRCSSKRSLSPEPHKYSNFAKFQATDKEQPHPKPAAETYAKEPIKVSSWSPTLSSNPSRQESAEDSCEHHDSVSMYRGQPLCYLSASSPIFTMGIV